MSLEIDVFNLLSTIAPGSVYAYVTPDNGPASWPTIVYQPVGGTAGWYVDQSMPSHKHARVQITIWATDPIVANETARAVEKAFSESNMVVEPYGAFVGMHEPVQKLYGTRQDFGINYPN